ncbi:Methyl-CpG-binding domain-containing protein 7 [Morus notabilis]|uniref:Methyl-CpG-binding domain-containing protein 7 n=1 Tax=Morus notabilis TaxID=981085 RepID=W9SJY7_9ROSA|nr:Methyl-CpG-binding domain-containing protein 7 [Morus notabilis]
MGQAYVLHKTWASKNFNGALEVTGRRVTVRPNPRTMKGKSPPLKAVPLQMVTPRKDDESSDHHKVGSTSTPAGFKVPDDWLVEEIPRACCPSNPRRVDRYYIEPKTGKKFRSVPEVKRYLMDGNTDAFTSEVSNEAGNKSDMQITPLITWSTSDFVLPDGWRIEEKPRSSGMYRGMVDKYYIESKTGKKFRSMAAVKRYLTDGETNMSVPEVSKEASDKSDMQIIPFTTGCTSDFVLPNGWRIEQKRRDGGSNPGKIDKYYIEPGTGKKFCSVMAVKRHLTNGSTNTSTPTSLKQGRDKRAASVEQAKALEIVLMKKKIFKIKRKKASEPAHPINIKFASSSSLQNFPQMHSMIVQLSLEIQIAEECFRVIMIIVIGGKFSLTVPILLQMQITPCTPGTTSNFILPDGWIIERRKRRRDFAVDKYYVEQETGQQFRSLIAVERYLREKEEKECTMPLKAFKHPNRHHRSRGSGSKSKNVYGKNHSPKVATGGPKESEENATPPKEVTPGSDPTSSEHSDTPQKSNSGEKAEAAMDDSAFPPSTMNWVLAGPGGDMWTPFIGESMVLESVKQKWSETFISSLNDN